MPIPGAVSVVPAREITTDQVPGAPSKYWVRARKVRGAALTTAAASPGWVRYASTPGAFGAKLARRSRARPAGGAAAVSNTNTGRTFTNPFTMVSIANTS